MVEVRVEVGLMGLVGLVGKGRIGLVGLGGKGRQLGWRARAHGVCIAGMGAMFRPGMGARCSDAGAVRVGGTSGS